MTKKIPQHSKESVEQYTPAYIVEPARAVLVEIDQDPASCAFANGLVRATTFFDKRGLERVWEGRTFLNPPGRDAGGGHASRSSQVVWWRKLVDEYLADRVQSAVFIGFSIELLQAAQGAADLHPLDLPVCVPAKRIRFDRLADDLLREALQAAAEEPDARKRAAIERRAAKLEPLRGQRVSGSQPTHANVIVGLPDFSDEGWVPRFRVAFEPVGGVWVPASFAE